MAHICKQPFDDVRKGDKVRISPFFNAGGEERAYQDGFKINMLGVSTAARKFTCTGEGVVESVSDVGRMIVRFEGVSVPDVYLREMILVEGIDYCV